MYPWSSARKHPDRCQVKTHRVLSNGYSERLWKRVEIRNRGVIRQMMVEISVAV